MRIPFIRTTTETTDTLMIAVAGQPYVLDAANHPRFSEIAALAAQDVSPEEMPAHEASLLALINFAQTALDTMRSLSERVSLQGSTIFFDGDPIENSLADHILQMINSGDDTWQAPVAFLEKLSTNPAKHVRKRLYDWISTRGLTLTPEGDVIGYKGVQDTPDNLSITSGQNTVYVDGVPHTGHIPNPLGATVTMSRSGVDSSRDAPCSHGLHVGTYDYASTFGSGSLLQVSFNPRDVVAIPSDSGFAKIRTCRYQVLSTTTAPYEGTTYAPAEEEEQDENTCSECQECDCDDDHA